MMRQLLIVLVLSSGAGSLWGQSDTLEKSTTKERLDFAKTYFEYGGSYIPSFTGKKRVGTSISDFEHEATFNQYLTWGAFHFWGHAEFYVTFPLGQFSDKSKKDQTYELTHSVVTGLRFYPWAMEEEKIRPFVGINWGALDFKQKNEPGIDQTQLSKDFMLNYEIGVLYNYKSFAARLGVTYFSDTEWNYPVGMTQKAEIKTPKFAAQLGILYAFDLSKDTTKERIDKWNSYPALSKLSYDAQRFGDFFVGIGPSMSFSLARSEYNQSRLPHLKEKLTSNNYLEIGLGYHFNKANLFTALSFRNPKFKSEGHNSSQVIKKTSFTFEVNKFLTDYSGFAPFIGLNLAYDKLQYKERVGQIHKELKFGGRIEPGLTLGWDIVPGKTSEALILRTNLRWYPWSDYKIDGGKFNFSQLEYNLIQLVFYPERLKKRK